MNNGNNGIYEFGKWVETEVIDILSKHYNVEILQTKGKFSSIDAMMFKDNMVYPCQIKAYAPRVVFRDISIPFHMYEKYKMISDKNHGYKIFQVNTAYNTNKALDYCIYGFDIKDTVPTISNFSNHDSKQHAFFKYNQMVKLDILPLYFQEQMEILKYQLNPPSPQYEKLYHKKF